MKSVFVVFAMVGILISFTPYSKANPPDGLVLHLSFDKNSIQGDTVKDLSEEGNDGTINGAAKTVAGKHGEALEFDGKDDFVEVPLEDSITFSTGDSFRRGLKPRLFFILIHILLHACWTGLT